MCALSKYSIESAHLAWCEVQNELASECELQSDRTSERTSERVSERVSPWVIWKDSSPNFHIAPKILPIRLESQSNMLDYIRSFCNFVHSKCTMVCFHLMITPTSQCWSIHSIKLLTSIVVNHESRIMNRCEWSERWFSVNEIQLSHKTEWISIKPTNQINGQKEERWQTWIDRRNNDEIFILCWRERERERPINARMNIVCMKWTEIRAMYIN